MNLRKYTKHAIFFASVLSMAALFSRCSAGSSTPAGSAAAGVTVSGSVGSIAAQSMSTIGIMAVAPTDLEVYGLALSDPPEVKKVNLNNDGSFSLSFSSTASGAEISLIFRYKSGTANAGKQVGLVKFVDDTKKNMDGTSSTSSSMKLAGTVSLGTLTINANGEVYVPISQVATNNQNQTTTSGTAFDFTGSWVFAAYDGTLPDGYSAACTQGDNNCNGPHVGESIYFKRLVGKAFTPDGSCDAITAAAGTCAGTASATIDRFAMMAWSSEAAWATCGSKLGFPYSLARFHANVDFTSSGVPEGAHTYSGGWVDGWINASATANYSINNCVPTSVTMPNASVKKGFKCFDNVSVPNSYNISFGGGCVNTATGTPVQVTNWSSITGGSCTSSTAGLPNGYTTNTCLYAAVDHDGNPATAAVNLTCPFTNGIFSQVDNSVLSNSDYNWTNSQLIAQGAPCGNLAVGTDSQKIAKMRCYADYYRTQEQNSALCLQRMTMDWSATTPASFATPASGAPKANSEHTIALFNYTSPTSGVLEDEEVHFSGVQVGDSFIPCKVASNFKASLKSRTTTQAVFEFVSQERSLDFSEPACAAANRETKTIMLINKQP